MTYKVPLPLTAAFLLSSTLAAQQNLEHARDAAFREAEHYASCWTDAHPICLEELTDLERLEAAGLPIPDLQAMGSLARVQRGALNNDDLLRRMEVAEPWPLFAVDDALFAFVPYFETSGAKSFGARDERVGYLIGASDDSGESWRFIQVDKDTAAQPDAIDRIVPGYRNRPQPEVLELEIRESPFAESGWVETTERRFIQVEGSFAYDLKLRLRRSFSDPIDLFVRYDNPADRTRPLQFRGSLEPRQRQLQWQSPALTSFESGQVYGVVIEGSDPDTGELLFEHREQLLFQPTRELWLSVMSKPPDETAE